MRVGTHRAIALLLGAAACSEADVSMLVPDPEILRPTKPRKIEPPPIDEEIFDLDRILEVDIFVAQDDWARVLKQVLRPDALTVPDCQKEPFPAYPFQRATVVINRQIVENVGIRQRGFFWQINEYLPTLELAFDAFDPDQRFAGRHRLLLESVPYDPTGMRACLAYQLFAKAGLPSPRCSFAAVRVNGGDLGIYAHVEAIDDDFTAERFGDRDPVWEGKASDFRDGWMATFDGPTDHAALDAVRTALGATDDQLPDRLGEVMDLDEFVRFWAVETVIGHFDGYSGNANRFFVASDPERGLVFVPADTQTAFYRDNPFLAGEEPAAVYAQGELARRLFFTAGGRGRYRDALEAILAEVWDANELIAQIDHHEALIRDRFLRSGDQFKTEVQSLRDFVLARADQIQASIGDTWPYQRRPSFCFVPRGLLSASFSTIWDSLPQPGEPFEQIFNTGTGVLAASYDDVTYEPTRLAGAAAGRLEDGHVILVTVVPTNQGGALALYIAMDPELVAPGTFTFDQSTVWGTAAYYTSDLPQWTGYLVGSVKLDQASLTPGAPIDVVVSADLY